MSQTVRDLWLLVAISLLVFFGNLGAAPLWDRDEPRNAGCTAEMLQADELIVPVFNGELRTHKPIMLYWLMMVSYSVFGINEFGARAVSAFAGMSTVLLTYAIGRRLFGRDAGFWSGVVLTSTIMFSVASRAATPDALLVFCGTLAIYFFVRGGFSNPIAEKRETGMEATSDSHERADDSPLLGMPQGAFLYAMYAAMGLGVLVKGPVGLVLPTAVIGMFLLIVGLPSATAIPLRGRTCQSWQGSAIARCLAVLRPFYPLHFLRTCWQMRPVTALLTAGVIAVPWYVWVHLRTEGVWTSEFFWVHNVSRASATMEGHAGPPILFYAVTILVGFFPWSILTVPVALRTAVDLRSTRQRWALILLLCWVGVYVGLFSVAKTKLPSYITPCYPALAILFGYFVSTWQQGHHLSLGWFKVGLAHWIVVGVAMAIAIPIVAARWLPGSQWLGLLGGLLGIGGVLSWRFLARQQIMAARNSMAITAVGFIALVMILLPAELGRRRQDAQLLGQIRQHCGPVVAYGHLEPSWVFYGGKPIREFPADQVSQLSEYLAQHPDCMLITTDRRWLPLSQQQASFDGLNIVCRADYFLRNRELLLLTGNAWQTLQVSQSAGELSKPY